MKELNADLHLNCELGWAHAKRTPKGKHVKALRPVTLVDSRVSNGASYKGSAKRLNSELRKKMPHTLFTKLYNGTLFCGTKFNAADAPTRDREPEAPTSEREDWISYDGDQLHDFLRRLSETWLKQQTVRDSVLFDPDPNLC